MLLDLAHMAAPPGSLSATLQRPLIVLRSFALAFIFSLYHLSLHLLPTPTVTARWKKTTVGVHDTAPSTLLSEQ